MLHYILTTLQNGWASLHAAAHNNEVQLAEMLIKFGANVDIVTEVRKWLFAFVTWLIKSTHLTIWCYSFNFISMEMWHACCHVNRNSYDQISVGGTHNFCTHRLNKRKIEQIKSRKQTIASFIRGKLTLWILNFTVEKTDCHIRVFECYIILYSNNWV